MASNIFKVAFTLLLACSAEGSSVNGQGDSNSSGIKDDVVMLQIGMQNKNRNQLQMLKQTGRDLTTPSLDEGAEQTCFTNKGLLEKLDAPGGWLGLENFQIGKDSLDISFDECKSRCAALSECLSFDYEESTTGGNVCLESPTFLLVANACKRRHCLLSRRNVTAYTYAETRTDLSARRTTVYKDDCDQKCYVELFQNSNFTGPNVSLVPGFSYNEDRIKEMGFESLASASSLKVHGKDCAFTAFERDTSLQRSNQWGLSALATFKAGEFNLAQMQSRGIQENAITEVKVFETLNCWVETCSPRCSGRRGQFGPFTTLPSGTYLRGQWDQNAWAHPGGKSGSCTIWPNSCPYSFTVKSSGDYGCRALFYGATTKLEEIRPGRNAYIWYPSDQPPEEFMSEQGVSGWNPTAPYNSDVSGMGSDFYKIEISQYPCHPLPTVGTEGFEYSSIGMGQCTDENWVLIPGHDPRSIGWSHCTGAYDGGQGNCTDVKECQKDCDGHENCEAIGYWHGNCWLYAKMCRLPYVKTNSLYPMYECFVKSGPKGIPITTTTTTTTTTDACYAELWENGGFDGWNAVLPEGDYNYDAFIASGAQNDAVSSLKVHGKDCWAAVYEHGDFTGWAFDIPAGDYSSLDGWAPNDAISSIKVFRSLDRCYVEVWEHGGHQGWHALFPEGEYNYDALIARGARNDAISSMEVHGEGCHALVYEHGDFTGWHVDLPKGDYNSVSQNDAISSIKVIRRD